MIFEDSAKGRKKAQLMFYDGTAMTRLLVLFLESPSVNKDTIGISYSIYLFLYIPIYRYII